MIETFETTRRSDLIPHTYIIGTSRLLCCFTPFPGVIHILSIEIVKLQLEFENSI